MKKFIYSALMLLISLVAFAQNQMQIPQLPVDKDVRIGRLPNGLTYYIRHNAEPKGLAEFYIAQKVGSILEEENQRGLAHFLEHMCFNGTTNFPDKTLIQWLESNGVKFGENLNAYTAVDRTVYYLTHVPVARESVQDSCLLILHDWANDLLLKPEEINSERGVIHEEWRRTMAGQMRIMEKILPTVFQNERYGYRLPIGIMEVVDNFEPQALRDYYETWYRPDLQGIMVVGDVDVDRIEAKIKEMFSSIEMPENPRERVYFPVSDNEETIFAIGSDKEQTSGLIQLMIKQDVIPEEYKNTPVSYQMDYVIGMACNMLNKRLSDMMSNPETPFAGASAGYGDFIVAKTKDAFTLGAVTKSNDVRPAFEAAYRELLRALRGGFTQGEYDRVRSQYLSNLETAWSNRDKQQSSTFVNSYVENFLDGEPIPDFETEYNMMKQIAANVNIGMINQAFSKLITDNNRVVMVMTPDNGTFHTPTADELKESITKVEAENIEAYVDDVKTEPLIKNLPAAGKIVAEKQDDRYNTTRWTLSNGMTVIVKPTEFKQDEIIFSAVANGGLSSVSDDKAASIMFLPTALGQSGLGDYNGNDLSKYLAGKMAGYSISFSDYGRTISGSATKRDLPTAMELFYMAMTDPTITPEEYASTVNMVKANLAKKVSDPQYIFSGKISETLYDNPRRRQMTPEIVDQASREEILDIVHTMLANPADFTLVFVGSIDLDQLRPLVEKYVASLPVNPSKSLSDFKVRPELSIKKGSGESAFTTKMENPQTWTLVLESGDMEYSPKQALVAYVAGEILGNRLMETVREDMGATYSIGAQGGLSRLNKTATMETAFPMKPETRREVLDFIAKAFKEMESTVKQDEVSKQVEYLLKNNKASLDKNGTWLGAITGYELTGIDSFNGKEDVIKSITVEDVQNFMKQLNAGKGYRVVTLDPEK